ncbi:MAG: hypothetical protein KIH69_013980 [Anaerolineae bacterium]|nr:hypothetical protein [Anaerolineae bacterium]
MSEPTTDTDQNHEDQTDLGFSYLATKAGLVLIRHHRRMASELRGAAAADFLKKVNSASFAQAQQLMARITGNYKRGNERAAGKHARSK